SSGESTANLPRTAVGAVMFLAGEEAWPIDIIASELSSARPSGGLAKTAFRSQGARGAFLGSAVPLRRPARRHGRAPPLYRRKGKAPRPRGSLRDGGRGSCRESARQTASAPTARQALIAPENSWHIAPHVAGTECVGGHDISRQKAAAQGTVCDKTLPLCEVLGIG